MEVKAETYEDFLARGGRHQILATTDRALTCPNREFSIVSQGERERKRQQERQPQPRREP